MQMLRCDIMYLLAHILWLPKKGVADLCLQCMHMQMHVYTASRPLTAFIIG